MSDFELLRNITIGQYLPTGSSVHRLDPRAKIIAALLLFVGVAYSNSLVANLILLLTILLIAWLARIPLGYVLRGIRPGLGVLIFIFVMQLLFQGQAEPAGVVYVAWGWFRLTRYSLHLILVSLFRIISFVYVTSLVSLTTTTTELTHGVESMLKPFQRIGVPAHELALTMTIALRFVPTLAEELERITKAQASRGADLGGGRIWRPDKAARAYLPLIVPLFINALRRGEDLILAMEARGYVGGKGRSHFIQLHNTWRDTLVIAGALFFTLAIIFLPWPALKTLAGQIGWHGL
jgi:energy-coupling factor transport system permease protein